MYAPQPLARLSLVLRWRPPLASALTALSRLSRHETAAVRSSAGSTSGGSARTSDSGSTTASAASTHTLPAHRLLDWCLRMRTPDRHWHHRSSVVAAVATAALASLRQTVDAWMHRRAKDIAPKDQLQSLAAVKSLIAEVQAMDAKAGAAPAAAGARRKVGADSASLGNDCAWYPAVPLGHTAYSWGADDESGEVKLSDVFHNKAEHHYVSKHAGDAAPAPAAAAPAASAAAPAADKKDQKQAKEQKPKGGDSKKADAKADGKKADGAKKDDGKKKDDKKKGGGKPEMPKPTAAAGTPGVFARLDIRAGKIVKAQKHPNADKLYVEQIDLGEPTGPRTIVSGLVEHIPLNEFEGASVLVVCNLKPADMRGTVSHGMVLAASNDNRKTVELVAPAAGSKPGDRVYLKGGAALGKPDAVVDLFEAGNAWIDAKDFLTTDANCHAQYNGVTIVTAAGEARSKSKANGKIS